MPTSSQRRAALEQIGKLRIGDDWNAINIIALSQSNPLKAVAEFTWFERWIRGKPWFTWKELLKAVEDSTAAAGRVAGN